MQVILLWVFFRFEDGLIDLDKDPFKEGKSENVLFMNIDTHNIQYFTAYNDRRKSCLYFVTDAK